MGYCISMTESKFRIKRDNIDRVITAIEDLAKNMSKELKYVACGEISYNIDEAFDSFGYMVHFADDRYNDGSAGDIVGIDLTYDKLWFDYDMFQAIAPYVEDGSYIEISGEDGELWRWCFKNGKCLEIYPKIVWDM